MTGVDMLFKNEHQVLRMLRDGIPYREIGQTFGVSKDVVAYYCKINGLSRGSNKNTEEDAARKIKEKSGGLLEYVSGYTIKEKPVRVRCLVCGGEFERTFHNITTKGRVTCPCCIDKERSERKAKQEYAKLRRNQQVKANRGNNSKQMMLVVCASCGEPFFTWSSSRVFCSNSCAKKSFTYTQGSDDRLNKRNVVDKDITLEKLYERDRGVCQICGGKCDYSDYHYNDNGVFIAGDLYPSKDHIVPLRSGGVHSWDNIRLAHRICNSKLYWKEQRYALPVRETS